MIQENVFLVRAHLACRGKGWEEVHALKTANEDEAITHGTELILRRRGFFSLDTELVFASVSLAGGSRDGAALGNFPIGPLPQVNTTANKEEADKNWYVDAPEVCYLYRFETATRRWGNKPIRGIPDWFVRQKKPTIDKLSNDLTLPATLTNVGDTRVTAEHYALCYLAFLKERTFLAKLVEEGENAGKYDCENFTRVKFRSVSTHKCGKVFGVTPGRAYR